ncbi:MAG: SAM-dependent methyltransferase, partial [Candidatus Micrarchaeota archaeon]|nr:SAM-dependent methyltransferase [Candidatus Micrarchaeota archaeon]
MLYLLFTADSFRESTLDELAKISGYKIIDEYRNLIIADLKSPNVERRLDRSVFVYSYFPIASAVKLKKGDYTEFLRKQIKKLKISKDTKLKLECYDINCKRGYSAKEIEIAIGSHLEGKGHNIDIKTPEVLAYVILLNGVCYSGSVKIQGNKNAFVDPFRRYKEKLVSRAEFKIAEAFGTFNIGKVQTAIDLGAAPGGWSLYLARKGSAVVAIDGAELDVKAIKSNSVDVIKTAKILDMENLKPKSVVHLKLNVDKAIKKLGVGQVDLLANDMNMGGINSSKAVLRYWRFLKKGGVLLMTVKCMRRNVLKYV